MGQLCGRVDSSVTRHHQQSGLPSALDYLEEKLEYLEAKLEYRREAVGRPEDGPPIQSTGTTHEQTHVQGALDFRATLAYIHMHNNKETSPVLEPADSASFRQLRQLGNQTDSPSLRVYRQYLLLANTFAVHGYGYHMERALQKADTIERRVTVEDGEHGDSLPALPGHKHWLYFMRYGNRKEFPQRWINVEPFNDMVNTAKKLLIKYGRGRVFDDRDHEERYDSTSKVADSLARKMHEITCRAIRLEYYSTSKNHRYFTNRRKCSWIETLYRRTLHEELKGLAAKDKPAVYALAEAYAAAGLEQEMAWALGVLTDGTSEHATIRQKAKDALWKRREEERRRRAGFKYGDYKAVLNQARRGELPVQDALPSFLSARARTICENEGFLAKYNRLNKAINEQIKLGMVWYITLDDIATVMKLAEQCSQELDTEPLYNACLEGKLERIRSGRDLPFELISINNEITLLGKYLKREVDSAQGEALAGYVEAKFATATNHAKNGDRAKMRMYSEHARQVYSEHARQVLTTEEVDERILDLEELYADEGAIKEIRRRREEIINGSDTDPNTIREKIRRVNDLIIVYEFDEYTVTEKEEEHALRRANSYSDIGNRFI
jgi:hypothetical protein